MVMWKQGGAVLSQGTRTFTEPEGMSSAQQKDFEYVKQGEDP